MTLFFPSLSMGLGMVPGVTATILVHWKEIREFQKSWPRTVTFLRY